MKSIRRTVSLAILLPLLTGVGLTGWIAYYNAHQTVNELAKRLGETVNQQIQYRLEGYLATPPMIVHSNAIAIQLGELNIQNPTGLTRHFWEQSKEYGLGGIRFGYQENGALRSVVRLKDQSAMISIADDSTGFSLVRYAADSSGKPAQELSKTPNFDSRTRSWYMDAASKGKPTWTAPFPDFATQQIRIAASQPVYRDGSRTLLGVVASDFLLTQISDFLRSLKVGKTGKAFIVERSGNLIATSSNETIFNQQAKTIERVSAIASQDALIQATAQSVQNSLGGFGKITREQPLKFKLRGETLFAYITPFRDQLGLDWLVAVVVPEKDFMEGVQRTTQSTIVLGLGALGLSAILGLLATRWLVDPIVQLNLAAMQVKSRRFNPGSIAAIASRPDEIGQLARVFQDMARNVGDREQELSDQVHQLEQALEKAKKLATVNRLGRRVNVEAVIQRSQQTRLQLECEKQNLGDLLRKVVYFQSFSNAEIEQLTQAGYQTQYTAKEYICREDEPGDTFFIILVGRVEVYIEKLQQPLGVLSAGDFFGELALLLGVPRTATVRTLEPTILYAVNQKRFQTLLQANQELADDIAMKLNERKADLEQRKETLRKHGLLGKEGKFMPNVFTWVRQRLRQIFEV